MEVYVRASMFGFANWIFPEDSVVSELLDRFVQKQGFRSSTDFYVVRNGRLSALDECLQPGAVYHLEPRLCGGKGGFGSMLRALGAQIEKTTNREACRDLSGRRLRDVNHEKEMADWLKKQAEREAEKEQQRAERLQRKLREPEHRFSDVHFQQQCHELSERLEDSVIKGLQATSSGQVRAGHGPASKRHPQSKEPDAKKRKMATCWIGLEELQSSEEDDDDDEGSKEDCVSALSSPRVLVPEPENKDPGQISRVQESRPSDQQEAPGPSRDQGTRSSEQQEAPGPSRIHDTGSSNEQEAPGPSRDQGTSLEQQEAPGPSRDQGTSLEQQEAPGPSRDQGTSLEQQEAPGPSRDQGTRSSEQQEAPGPSRVQESRTSDQQEAPGPSRDQETGSSEQQEVPGLSRDQENKPTEQVQPVVDLTTVTCLEQLEVLGLDVLKEELRRRGLKCGGTLAERAGRLFSIRGLTPEQVDPALLAKPTKTKRKP